MSDFHLAGQVVFEFSSLGNVARAMVVQGMKEYAKQTFGEEALALFGEEESSSGSSGSKPRRGGKSQKISLAWDTEHKGPIFRLSDDKLSFSTGSGYEGWNSILSNTVFSEGIHYVEVHLDKTGDSGFIFYGIGTTDDMPLTQCIGGAQSCLVAGYDARFIEGNHPGVTKHNRVDEITQFTRPQFIGLIIDLEEKQLTYVLEDGDPILAYSGIPTDVRIFACCAHNITATFTKHVSGKSNIEKYIKNRKKEQEDYKQSDFVNEWINK
eukprot:TRINITY_DN16656_c1_g1_i1.p1 TRINITY_DN16656_c1_g1~~TRINITY_DN16656_c1_g1_i1.p1  ORF type:complete len:290 (-),score=91.77 TRINITY_DN16656_c1_g1_i1:18-818(-)